ncbi:DUF1613-domain-containing protein [Tricholoma matsutake]|nr:DUF1613-domain-containing protein [Tricholoma matsutake 945]
MTTRHRFEPLLCDPLALEYPPLVDASESTKWLPLISCTAAFPVELFETAVSQLIHHPEYNSTLILRSQTVDEITSDFPLSIPRLKGRQITRVIHRRLLPRRPGRDASLDQYCSLYTSDDMSYTSSDTLVLTPFLNNTPLPYYHPTVTHLAFQYLRSSPSSTLRVEVVPLPGTPIDSNSRLYRTCLALLDTLDRYGWGAMTNYRKRVLHDCLVPREAYQDLYLVMRERHKHLVDSWQEVTDPLKHVFEDIGIATFLMLLWKDTFTPNPKPIDQSINGQPWKSWPRPPTGFLDFGCGNGLLTHILTSEGYEGRGIDLRPRTSWSHYPPSTQACLHVYAFDPTSTLTSATTPMPAYGDPGQSMDFFKPGTFLIGNHADELTPWVPVLSTVHSLSGYINIPCCAWSFDAKYERSKTSLYPLPPKLAITSEEFVLSLNMGAQGEGGSSYSMYRTWLAYLSLHCGWEVECEVLRIPSTRNWALVGRRRTPSIEEEEAVDNAKGIVQSVIERGLFKARKPEGKGNDH